MPDVYRRAHGAFLGTLVAFLVVMACPASPRAEDFPSASGAPLTLREALAQALLHNPELEIYSREIRAREAEALQAGLRPNPSLSLESENVFGSGEFSGTGGSETTFAVHQTIELGKKRSLRRDLAESQAEVARSDFLLAKSDLLARTSEAYFSVLAAQERLLLTQELADLSRKVLETVEERIASGRAAQTEVIRPRIQLREQQIALERARRDLTAARSALAALMGKEKADYGSASGDLSHLPPLPEAGELEKLLLESPEIARNLAERESRRRATRLEEARRIPDLEVGVGARYLRESEDTALVLGVSVPLPLFDRNQGAIAAARSREAQARAAQRSALVQARAALDAILQRMSAATAETEILGNDIVPAARQALEAAQYGYKAGKFALLDVLDAQRTLVEAQERHFNALGEFHSAAAELERLTGYPIHSAEPLLRSTETPRSDAP